MNGSTHWLVGAWIGELGWQWCRKKRLRRSARKWWWLVGASFAALPDVDILFGIAHDFLMGNPLSSDSLWKFHPGVTHSWVGLLMVLSALAFLSLRARGGIPTPLFCVASLSFLTHLPLDLLSLFLRRHGRWLLQDVLNYPLPPLYVLEYPILTVSLLIDIVLFVTFLLWVFWNPRGTRNP